MRVAFVALVLLSCVGISGEKGLLKVASGGFQDGVAFNEAAAVQYMGEGGFGSVAFPWKDRIIEFGLDKQQSVDKIELTMDKLNKTRPENTIDLEKAVLFVSDDGVSFKQVQTAISTTYKTEKDVLFATVTLNGPFTGRYFRLAADWKNNFYVFRFNGLLRNLKVFGVGGDIEAGVPFIVTGDLPVHLSGDVQGKTASVLAGGKLLWKGQVPVNAALTVPVKELKKGMQELDLLVEAKDGVKISRKLQFMYDPERIFLESEHDDWEEEEYATRCGTLKFLKAKKYGSKLTFKVERGGKYALYSTLRGKSGFNIIVNGKIQATSLQAKHVLDVTPTLAGENFEGLFELKEGAKIVVGAKTAGSEFGPLSISPVSDEEYNEYFAKAEPRPAAILHADGYSNFFVREVTKESLETLATQYKEANAFALDWCVGTSAVNFPSKVATMFGKQKNARFWRNGDRLAAERLERLLRETGSDPIRILRDKTRALGLRFSVTVRANAWYTANLNCLNAQRLIEHPEWMMCDAKGKRRNQPSYAYQGVRDFYLGLVKEIVEYEPDAITIEFLRHPPFFGYDAPLIEAYKAKYGSCTPKDFQDENWLKLQAEVMTAWLREVRRAIDAKNPKIALEINFDWKNYYRHGIDVENILKEGLVDMISPGIYHVGEQKYFPLAPFMKMVKSSPRKVLVFPRIEATIYGGDATPDEEKGLVKIERKSLSHQQFAELMYDFWREGADGLRPFNTGGAALAKLLANPAEIRRFNLYVRPLLQLRQNVGEK
ncbi:MAG: family 10 glycosylhydrolase [Victivallales bacterium]|nr:family 10 glycosylhydrolase [Victivallales bacterium]